MPWDDPIVSAKTEWLELTWWTDGDGSGRLEAAVYAAGWGGCSEAWFDRQAVLNFANALRTFPLPADVEPLESGYSVGPDWKSKVTTVRLGATPVGHRGQVGIDVELRPWGPDALDEQPQAFIAVQLPCTYPALERFAHDIELMVGDDVLDPAVGHLDGHARIEGERM